MTPRPIISVLCVLIWWTFAAGLPGVAYSENARPYYLTRAINSLTVGDIDKAETHFDKARDAAGDSAEINLRIGELYLDYTDNGHQHALLYFETAIDKEPALARARLRLGEAYYREGRFEPAREALELLLSDSDYAGYARYYIGIIAIEQRDFTEAARLLQPVDNLPAELQADARFQLIKTDFQRRKYAEARHSLEQMLADADRDELHEPARQYLDTIDRATRPWSAWGILTLRYDSNPLITTGDEIVGFGSNTGEIDDYALVTQGKVAYALHRSPARELEASYMLYDIRYDKLSSNDQQGHIFGLDSTWFDERTDLALAYSYEYWSIENDKFQRVHRLSPSLTTRLTRASTTTIGYQLSYVDRYDDPRRTGPRHRLTAKHRIDLPKDWELGLGYRFELIDTDLEHESESNELSVDLSAPPLYGWNLDLAATYLGKRFPDAGTSGHRDREDNWMVSLSATRKLTDGLFLKLGTSYEENDSDDPLFVYDRYQFDIGVITQF